jgi:hypothetical protein
MKMFAATKEFLSLKKLFLVLPKYYLLFKQFLKLNFFITFHKNRFSISHFP